MNKIKSSYIRYENHTHLRTKKALEFRHSKVRDVHECDRIKAILLSSEGWSIPQIAQALRKHDSTISRHLLDFKNKQKLAPENGGSHSPLKADQTEKLIQPLSAPDGLIVRGRRRVVANPTCASSARGRLKFLPKNRKAICGNRDYAGFWA